MSRAARTLLIVVGIGLVGLFALTWLARRYANLPPTASVNDVTPAPQAPAPAPEPPPPAAEAAPVPSGPRESDLRDVDRFVAVRRALQQVIAEQPGAAKQLAAQLSEGDASSIKPLQLNLVFLMKYRLTREEAIQKAAWSAEGYRAVREEFLGWLEGTPPADPARAAAFEARRAALEKAVLAGLEPRDLAADSGQGT